MADGGHRLVLLEEAAHEADGGRFCAQTVGIEDAARQHQGVVGLGIGLAERHVDGDLVAQSSTCQPLMRPLFGATTSTRAPSADKAFLGSMSSLCSKPSVARMAMRRSFSC